MAPREPENRAPDTGAFGARADPSGRWAEVERLFHGTFRDRYRLEREIARGGMAIVFLARDLRHDRPVAVKVLGPERIDWGAERFLREIRFAARLTHPHILGVHDSGEVEGLLYYVMPYVEGESLRARLQRDGALPLPEALQLLRELADALVFAHGCGVVHRDLKPENVLLSGGHAVVVDFGIAKAVAEATTTVNPSGATLTSTGMAIGTPAYMAPEQAAGGGGIDHRADIYALGVIAYEILSGSHPFGARSAQALVAAHLTEQPAPLVTRCGGVPDGLADLVMRMLSKDPAMRPQSAREIVGALNLVGPAGSAPRPPRPPRTRTRTRTRLLAAALIALLVLGAFAWRFVRPTAGPATLGDIRTVAVLPFVNTSGNRDDDYFSDGLTDELAQALRRLPGLSVAGRMSSYTFKGKSATAQEIGRALDVAAIVTGTVQRSGERLRVWPQFVSTRDGRVFWDSLFESRSADVFAVQDEFTRATIAAVLAALGGPTPASTRVQRGTSNQKAYDLYLKGRYYWMARGTDNLDRSIRYFTQAIEADPSFARAYSGLALAYRVYDVYQLGGSDTLQSLLGRYAQKAIALDSTDADGMVALASWLEREGRDREAEARTRDAIRLDPSNPTVHHWHGLSLLSAGQTDDAVAELRQAVRLDPLSKSPAATYVTTLVAARRLDEARDELARVLALDPVFPLSLWAAAQIHLLTGHPDSAASTLELAGRLYPDAPGWRSQLIFAYAAAGRWADADRLRRELARMGDGQALMVERALAEVAWGDRNTLISLLQRDEGRRAWVRTFGYIGCDPLLDPVRNDPRFGAMMRGAGIVECHPAKPFRLPAAGPPARRVGGEAGL